MKKVWVNRFNADGSMKPMSEWRLLECREWEDFCYYAGEFFYFCRKSDRRWTKEELTVGDLSDQRGDGWFYVADGDLPPCGDSVVLAWSGETLSSAAIRASTVIKQHERCKKVGVNVVYPCWQPITPPKFMYAP